LDIHLTKPRRPDKRRRLEEKRRGEKEKGGKRVLGNRDAVRNFLVLNCCKERGASLGGEKMRWEGGFGVSRKALYLQRDILSLMGRKNMGPIARTCVGGGWGEVKDGGSMT